MANKFLDKIGLTTLLNKLKTIFATESSVNTLKEETDIYVTDIDEAEIALTEDQIKETVKIEEE